MIPLTTNELKQHSNDLANFGENLRKMNGSGKAFVNVTVVVVAMISAVIYLTPMVAQIA
ncbi:MAG: hypothetical protein JKY41_08155 [Rhodobacteraceae bacterium]|nr:hypothetical protein [Paracoccaceae bacterium]